MDDVPKAMQLIGENVVGLLGTVHLIFWGGGGLGIFSKKISLL